MSLALKKKEQINLIPEDQRVSSFRGKLTPILIALVIVGIELGVFVFLRASIFAQNEALKKVNADLDSQTPVWQKLEPVASAIKSIQAKKITYDQTSAKYLGMDKKLDKVRSLLPEGVSLNTLDIDNEGNVAVVGKSVSADNAYQYYNVLKEQKDIRALSFESISKISSDYSFNLKFTISLK